MAKRGRPAKAKKTADDGVGPGIGHNDLTDEQRAALLFQAAGKIEREQAKMRGIVASIRLIRKQAKADGVDKSELNYVLYLRKAESSDALAEMAMRTRVAKWMGTRSARRAISSAMASTARPAWRKLMPKAEWRHGGRYMRATG